MTAVLHVRDSGDGPAVLLLHAFPCDGRMWGPQAAALVEAGWRVLVPDLPGFGDSALLDGEPSLENVADALIGILDERGIDSCILGGVSLGGYLAMAVLRARPELAGAVVLCGTKATADADDARANRERLASLVLQAPADTGRILRRAVLPGLLGESTHAHRPSVAAEVTAWLDAAPAESVAWYQQAMAVRPDSREVLADLAVPALLVWGEEDALSSRREQDLMLASLALGEIAVIDRAGHLAGVERPAAVGSAIVQFATTVRGPRPS